MWGADETATVAPGTGTSSNSYVPVYKNYIDEALHTQIIYPASMVEDLAGTLKAMKFYATQTTFGWGSPEFNVKIEETTESQLTGLLTLTDPVTVYSGVFTISGGELSIPFSSNFTYSGNKNLLVDIQLTTTGTYLYSPSLSFYGDATQTKASYVVYGGSNYTSSNNFIPKTTFTYEPAPVSCPKPALSLDNKDDESATFSWTQGGTETQWQYLCLPAAIVLTDEHWASSTLTSETSVKVSSLDAHTSYSFYLRAYCSADDQSKVRKETFTTDCGIVTIPEAGWTYSFEAADGATVGAIPECWIKIAPSGAGSFPTVSSSYAKQGSNKLHFQGKGSSATPQYVVLPEFDVDVKNLKVSFWFRRDVDYSYTSKPQLGYFSTKEPTSTSTFTSLGTPSASISTTYQRYELDLKDAPAGAKRIAIKFTGGTSASYTGGLFIDSIKVVSTLDCSAPQNVTLSGSSISTADFTWDANTGVDSYKYCVVAQGEEADWSGNLSVNTNSVHVEGLSAGNYTFYVKCACGTAATSRNFSIVSCGVPTNMQFSNETYNSVTVTWTSAGETEWDLEYEIGDLGFIDPPIHLTEATYSFSGMATGSPYTIHVKAACKSDFSAGDYLEGTITPSYTAPVPVVSDETDAQATVTWAEVSDADSYEYVVMLGTADADWTSPEATDATSATLTGLIGGSNYTVYVRSVYGSNYSNDGSAAFSTTKIAPTTLVKDAATTESITFSWSYTGAVNQFQWKTSKTGSDWSTVQSAKSATATGLESGTTYTIYVRNYYADGIYSDVLSGSFNTECGSKAIGYYENFDAASALPACWESTNFGSGNNQWNIGMSWYECKSSWNSARFLAYKNSGSATSDLITPAIELTEPTMLKFFYLKNSTDVVAQVLIRISGEEDAVIGTLATKSSWAATADSIDLTPYVGQTAKIIFRAYGSTSNTTRYFYLDDVSFAYKYCAKPTNLAASATTDGAVVTWDDTELGPWRLRYRTNGVGDWTTINNIASKTYTIEGLIEQEYEVQVRTYCSTHRYSAWTNSETFTPQCPNVTEVTFADGTYNSVTVNWTADGEATWSLRYKTDGDWTTINNIDTKTYGLTGLTTGETYTVAVKASCKGDEGWVVAATTYTPQYGVPTNVTISDIKDVTATLAWDAAAGATGYQYIVLEGDVAADWTAPQATTELSVDLSGLSAATTYSVYVRAAYGLNFGEATAKETFTTITYAPTGLAETAHAETSASFSWNHNAEGAATRYEYVALDGTDTPTGSTAWTLLDNNVTVATVEGLNPGAAYTFYVRSVYANNAKSDYASLAFSTECAVRNMPFSEDFESGVSPLCWSAMNGTTDYYDYDGSYGWKVKTGDASYVMRYTSGTGIIYPALVMPQINIEANAQLSFKVRNVVSSKTVNGKVVVSAEGVADLETTLTNSNSLTEQQIDLSAFAGKVATIKFVPTSNVSGGRIDLDDVRVFRGVTLVDNVNNTTTITGLIGQTLEVTLGRTIYCDGDFNTICLPFSLPTLAGTPLAGGELWSFRYGEVVGGELQIRIAPATSIEAGVPYLITFASGADIVNPTFTDVTITKSVGDSVGQTDDVQFIGILKPQAFVEEDKNNLFVASNGMLAWSNVGTGTALSNLRSFRGYFHTETAVSGTPVANNMPARIVKEEQTATGCENIQDNTVTIKIIENNQVVIIRNGVKYTVQGQVISK